MFRTTTHTHTARGILSAGAAALAAAMLAACSGPSAGLAVVPTTVTATHFAPTTVTATATDSVTDTGTVTATELTTQVVPTTLTPKPRGTTTVVHTTTKVHTTVKTVTAPPPKPKIAFGDGSYVVGKDVTPGIYQASDPNPVDDLCYWETDSRDGEIIDNGVNNGIVHIGSSAFSVLVRGCGDWTKVG